MKPRALLVACMDVAPDKEEAFNHWYDTKHFPGAMSAPGLISGHRFRASRGTPKYWVIYEAESEEALLEAMHSPVFRVNADDFQENWATYVTNFSLVRLVPVGPD